MKNIKRNVAFVIAFAALASLGSAQVLNGAANAAGRMNMPAAHPPHPPPQPPPPAVSAGATAGTASAASTATRTPVMRAAAGVTNSAQAAGNASSATGVNANATTHGSAEGQANGLPVATAVPS